MKKESLVMPPRYLYKYRTINEFTKRMFTHREIYFASPAEFNDPFDSRRHFTTDNPLVSDLKKTEAKILELQGPQAVDEMYLYLLDPQNALQRNADCQLQNEWIHERVRLFCLSAQNDNIQMWSHYADHHKGICVQFDISKLNLRQRGQFHKVIYQVPLPSSNITGDPDISECLSILLTKHVGWQYEQEWRAIYVQGNPWPFSNQAEFAKTGIAKLPPETISGVIMECNISATDEREVRCWIAQRHRKLSIYRARLKEREFGLDIIKE